MKRCPKFDRARWLALAPLLCACIAAASPPVLRSSTAEGGRLLLRVGNEPAIVLRGDDARQQLLVTAVTDTGAEIDLTRSVVYESSPPGIVAIDTGGLVRPLADGSATILAKN